MKLDSAMGAGNDYPARSTRTMKIRIAFTKILALAAAVVLCTSLPAISQAQASRLVGTVTAINGTTLTVKTDAGEQQQVAVPDTATLKRLAPGEKDLNGGLVYTPLGKGVYIYTGLAFFRELPEGVPGAYRLFVNLLSASQAQH